MTSHLHSRLAFDKFGHFQAYYWHIIQENKVDCSLGYMNCSAFSVIVMQFSPGEP